MTAYAAPDPSHAAAAVTWVDISTGLLIPMLAIAATVLIAVWTYRHQQQDKHRDTLRDLFSKSLRAVADYQELPYLVRRRSDISPMTPAELARHASDVQSRLDFYIVRLQLESHALGEAYEALVRATRQEAGAHISEAWQQGRLTGDSDMPLKARYPRDNADGERNACLEVMRDHLSLPKATSPHT